MAFLFIPTLYLVLVPVARTLIDSQQLGLPFADRDNLTADTPG